MIKSIIVYIASFITVIFAPGLGIHVRVVVNERYIYAIRASTRLQQLHVGDGWVVGDLEGCVDPLISVFVLNLIDEDIAAISDLVLGDYLGDLGEERGPSCGVAGVVISEGSVGSCSDLFPIANEYFISRAFDQDDGICI